MIVLNDLITMLTTGVLSNTVYSGNDGYLKESHYGKVASLINLGTLELYKRFKFLENELTLHVTPETRNYYLRSDKVAEELEDISEILYIENDSTADGFLNIIKILAVYDADGEEIRIDFPRKYAASDDVNPTIMRLGVDVLQITDLTAATTLSVVYQSYPNKLTASDFYNADGVTLSLPDSAIDPLIAYIAAKVFKPMGANDSTANADKSAGYEAAYELACQKITMYGLAVQDSTERDSFDRDGWA